ncbi:MAG: hypothetical protein ACI9LU_002479 [Polaribacter sp.]|jgi:hypothetical protein
MIGRCILISASHSVCKEEYMSSQKIQFWNRVQLLSILTVFIAPITSAYLYKPANFNNYGELFSPPRPIPNIIMRSAGRR